MASQDVKVIIIGDSRSVERAFGRSSKAAKEFDNTATRSLSRVDSSFKKLERIRTGAFLGGAAAVAGIAAIKKTTDAASDLQEQISKGRQVFGQSARDIEAWSKITARSIGVSQTAALEATGTFGNLFDAIGVAGPQAADTSKRLVQLAADLASFNNASPADVLDALRSGLVGEVEPLRRFGVLLSEARVQQVALAQTGKTSVKALTDQEKALARVSIIFKDTANAQGDFSRTSEGLANQQRILAASVADLEANVGRLLLPAITKITGALVDATDAALTLTNALGKLGSIEIPPIEIPIIRKIIPGTGSTVGDAITGFLGDALDPKKIALRLNPAGNVALTLEELGIIDGLFDSNKMKGEVDAAAQKAIDEAFSGFKFPKPKTVDPAAFANLPGVDFDHAGLITGALDDILSGSRKAVDETTRKVKAGLNTEKLEKALDDKRDALAKALQKNQDAFAKFIGSLRLGVDRAELTPRLNDDLAALRALEAGLRKQVKAGVDVASAQSQLVGVTADIASKQKEIAANAQSIAQARQFKALGLTGTGEEIIPNVDNLRKQLASLSQRVIGAGLDSKLVNRLAGVRKLLSGQFGKLTDETRAAINDLFSTIRGEFDKGAKGPLTKTTSLNTKKLLDGLGLGPDMERELRARLSSFNSAGVALAGMTRPTGTMRGGIAVGGPTIVVENHNTVALDGDVVGRNVTKSQQKNDRRNPKQKTGPNAGV